MLINEKTKEKKWILKSERTPVGEAAIAEIARSLGLNPILARLLYNRGYHDQHAAKAFLYMESEMLSNPFDMIDMDKGVARIERAVKNGEKITVYGDYDVDGVTSVCTLYLYLQSLGAQVEYYIPNRSGEGYGVSTTAIDAIKAGGTSLIITVDTGITANEEVDYAKSIGLDFLITDHHECRSDLPAATAIINPHRPDCPYPFKELAGVGVVFKLICAYEERVCKTSRYKAASRIFSAYADLVAIGTIADVMPIKGENRIIVSYGLSMIENNPRIGLVSLMEASSTKGDFHANDKKRKKMKITSGYIGYTLAPRINAAGRIKSASIAVELFLAKNKLDADIIAEKLCAANKERQNEENSIIKEASLKIQELNIENDPVIVLDADNWHHGVIGIVSSRITEKYCRPSILVSFEGNDKDTPHEKHVGKGSGRSVKGMNLVDALCHCGELLVKFGGHELAAGLSVTRENLDAFRRKINEFARENLNEADMIPTFDADDEIDFRDVNLAFAEQLRILEPYGVGNPIPNFIIRGVAISELVGISEGKHSRISLTDGRSNITAMYFSQSPTALGVSVGDKVDVLFNVDINEWNGRKSVQLIVRDLKPSCEDQLEFSAQSARFSEIRAGHSIGRFENVVPTRDDFATVYKLVVSSVRAGVDTLSHKDICYKLSRIPGVDIGYIKLKFIVMIMKELNILSIDEYENEVYKFSVHYSSQKTDLEKSNLLKRLRNQVER